MLTSLMKRLRLGVGVAVVVLVAALVHPGVAAAATTVSAERPIGKVSVSVEYVPLASKGPLSPDYVAGSSVASYPTYDTTLWAKIYKCTYSGWAHVLVNYQCRLKDPYTGSYLTGFSGSFSDGSENPSARSYKTANVYLCTVASAGYWDGSAYDSDQKCA